MTKLNILRLMNFWETWMRLRAWWYLTFAPTVPVESGTGSRMPYDVRAFVVRRSMEQALKETTPRETKHELCSVFFQQGMSGIFDPKLTDELIAASFKLVEQMGLKPEPLPLSEGPYPIQVGK